jgi:hypothetical protein
VRYVRIDLQALLATALQARINDDWRMFFTIEGTLVRYERSPLTPSSCPSRGSAKLVIAVVPHTLRPPPATITSPLMKSDSGMQKR